MRASVILALASFALAGAGPSVAQPPVRDEQVVVVGTAPTREVVRRFVDQMSISSPSTNQLARWDRRICPGVAGLKTRYAEFLIDRIAQRAHAVEIDVGRPGCRPNVLIVVTPEPDDIARELSTRHKSAMGLLNEYGRSSLGRRHLRTFVNSDAPVRWWHVNRTHTYDGFAVAPAPAAPDSLLGLPGDLPVMQLSGNASRIDRTTRQDFASAFIIVDTGALSGIGFNWEGLADYLAMVTLAQLDPSADTSGYPTILNLFAEDHRVRALTDWDAAYLRGLYSTTREARSANQQEGEIARSVGHTLAETTARN